MLNMDFVRSRITELRMKKGVSEYKMSLDTGHSRSYIQNISSGRSHPSLEEFLYICDYLEVSPKDFFDDGDTDPILMRRAVEGMRRLNDGDLLMLIGIIERLGKQP